MFRFKRPLLLLVLGLIAPVYSFAANYCIAVNSGFGNGGTTFIGTGFAVPAKGTCSPWAGFTKTASTVIWTTTGTGCLSTDGKILTFSLGSVDPSWFGVGQVQQDYILLCQGGQSKCPATFGSQRDIGVAGGSAETVTCTTSLLNLPALHD